MLLRRLLLLLSITIVSVCSVHAQFTVSGTLVAQADSLPVIGATVRIFPAGDTVALTGNISDMDGVFELTGIAAGTYTVRITEISSKSVQRTVHVIDANTDLGVIKLEPSGNVLKGVTVTGQLVASEQKGDTSQFNAGAFKTNPDASAEDLVNKMPGFTSDNSGVKFNGENVKKVLVDGKEFFGNDASAALKNFPAEVIDKIQVFDQQSDQAQFTGFDDGNTQKTINIRTKNNKSNGQFGRIYAGYGTDDRYAAGGSVNYFDGNRRITLMGLANNINQQNFSNEDVLGVQSGRGGRGNSGNNFMIGQQNGITETNSIGLNYSDQWGKKVKVSASYFFSKTDNTNETVTERNYFATGDTSLFYRENSNSSAVNFNHRFNMRLEYNADSFNSLILTPTLSFQDNRNTSFLTGNSFLTGDVFRSATQNSNDISNQGFSFNNSLLLRHKFARKGRTISLDLGAAINNKSGLYQYYNLSRFTDDTILLDQQQTLDQNGYTLSGNLTYTEPVGKKGQLQVSYNPSYTFNHSDRIANNYDTAQQDYLQLDPALSNKYENRYTTQKGGLSYRLNTTHATLSVGVNGQYALLEGDQVYPLEQKVNRSFSNVLPQAMYNYRFEKGTNLRVFYRTSTQAPSISQLQNVADVSNPLFISTGNPGLVQSYEHSLLLRYGKTRAQRGNGLFLFANVSYTNDYFASASFIPSKDSVIANNVLLREGGQLSVPVNLDGYWQARSFVTYGWQLKKLKSNLNLNGGLSYIRNPSLINAVENFSNSYTLNGGVVISSNISEKIDFTLSWNGSYNVVQNTIQSSADNNYYYHNASFKFNWIFLDRFVLNTSITQSLYSGLAQSFDQQFYLWNAYLGYKFLKDKSLEARVSAYDILAQNRNIARNVTNIYIEDVRTLALTQYFMFTLTYTLRNFKAESAAQQDQQQHGSGPGEGRRWQQGGGQ